MAHKKITEQYTVNPDWWKLYFEEKFEAFKQGKCSKEDWEVLRPQFATYLKLLMLDLEGEADSVIDKLADSKKSG